jgi:PAS domain S-box-containing protein
MQTQSSSGIVLSSLSKFLDHDNAASMCLIADAIPQIVWIARPNGDFEFYNQAWRVFTGLALEESITCGWESALHPDDLHECRRHWLNAVRTGTAFETECRFRRASDGMYRWHLIRGHALKNDAGTVIKWIASSTDINDQKIAQHALREVVEEVERQVKERTAELLTTNMQLLEAISERRRAAALQEQDTQRLNDIIATQAHLVQAGLNLPSFLTLAAEKIHRLTGATGTVVEIIDGGDVVSAAAAGITVPFIGFRTRIADTLSGLCIRRGQILRCDNANDDPRVDLDACRKVGAVSLLVAPLYSKGNAVGALKILSDVPDAFGQRDAQTLELMAGLLGAAIAQQVYVESNERLLAERTHALTALQTEVENRLYSEQQLREAEHRTRLLLESSHDGFFSVNTDGGIVDWSREAENMFGWLRHEVMGKPFLALLFPEYARARVVAEFERIISNEKIALTNRRLEVTVLHRFGGAKSVELSISSRHDRDTQVVDVFARDIGRHRKTESRLAGREKTLRAIADHVPAWIAYIDAEEQYIFANAYYRTQSGIDPDGMIGRSLREVIGEIRYADMKDGVSDALRGKQVGYERTVNMKNGGVRQHVRYFPDIAEDGTVLGFYSIVTKVDESEKNTLDG